MPDNRDEPVSPKRWRQIQQIMAATLELSDGDRSQYLSRICRRNSSLRQDVETYLRHLDADDFLDRPAFDIHGNDPTVGRRIGPYRTLRLLGRGGMGSVYLATREDDYTQQVAVKLIKGGLDRDEIIRRFRIERQILANLEHPNIARLLNGGTTEDGLPYIVMEYVQGEPIDQYCQTRKLSVPARLELFRKICSAMQLSHQNLIIHRDLKPGNILVKDGEPKLLDFGIAKILNPSLAGGNTVATSTRQPMTLRYASPEQVRGEPVTTASDTYALGVLLFQLLTGTFPYQVGSDLFEDMARTICDAQPLLPSVAVSQVSGAASRPDGPPHRHRSHSVRQLARRLRGDLDHIVLKALNKDPKRRYRSVEQLSEDLRRHLEKLPVVARKNTRAYRSGKFVQRHKLAMSLGLTIVAFSMSSTILWRQAVTDRDWARIQESKAKQERARSDRVSEFLKNLFRYNNPDEAQGQDLTALEMLDRGRARIPHDFQGDLQQQAKLMGELGTIYHNLGRYDEAQQAMKDALRLERQHNPRDRPELATRVNNLAVLLLAIGQYGAAEQLFWKALDMRQRLGLNDTTMIKNMNNLASILAHRGAYSAAEDLYRQGLKRRLLMYGPQHSNVAASLYSLGTLKYLESNPHDAEPPLRRALAIWRDVEGARHTKVARALNMLGRALQDQGRLEEAEDYYSEALPIQQKRLGEAHLQTAQTKRNIASLLLERGEARACQKMVSEVLAVYRNIKSENDWEIAEAESLLGAALVAQGHYEQAETYLIASYSIVDEVRGSHSRITRETLRRIIDLYDAWGRQNQADTYRTKAKAISQPNSWTTDSTRQP